MIHIYFFFFYYFSHIFLFDNTFLNLNNSLLKCSAVCGRKIIKDFLFFCYKNKQKMDPEQKQNCVKAHIQDLERKEQPQGRIIQEHQLTSRLNIETNERGRIIKKKKQMREVYCYMDNGLKERLFNENNQFLMSFLIPYNHHGDILLTPDNIWLAISLYMSKHIQNNAERLRHHFVRHQGQKQLEVIEQVHSVEQSLKSEKKWDNFFEQIIKKIQENTNEGVVETMACNFSTTNKLYKIVSTAIIMNSFKKYFTYKGGKVGCGINNVYFEGTREDWVKLKQKLLKMNQYDIANTQLNEYVESVSPILDKFIESYDGNIDTNWWNSILATEQERARSGMIQGTYVEGWLLNLFGVYYRTHIKYIPMFDISVPIKLVNELTKTVKHLELKAEWVSVSKVNQYLYKPDIGLCIFKNSEEPLV